jgi:hypothetical protein
MVTLPKLKDVGLAERFKTGATPVPLIGILVGELGALLTRESVAAKLLEAVGVKFTVNALDWPAATVNGKFSPLRANPAPVIVACDTFRLALPGLIRVTVWVPVRPIVTLLKLTLVGTTEICGCIPAPESEIVAGELVALLTTDTLPATLPAIVGANPTLSEALCPVARLRGKDKPLTLKPAPVTFTCETVTVLFPEFVRTTVCAPLALPTITFPKLKLLVLVESRYVWVGEGRGAMPVPATETVLIVPAVARNERLPEKLLVESGMKTAWKDAVSPFLKVKGRDGPVKMNSGKLLEVCWIMSLWLPLLVKVITVGELAVLTLTEPKFNDDGLTPIPA